MEAPDGKIRETDVADTQTLLRIIQPIPSPKAYMRWTQAVSGKLELRIRYSVNLTYNSFPFPLISNEQLNNR
jgi:hypothetical protein